jgi:Restriction endonuclease NotI
MAKKKDRTRRRYAIGEWYGGAFEFFSPKQRCDQAKLHAGLTTIAGFDCPFQKNRICTKKRGVCSLRAYEQIGDGPVTGVGPLMTTCPNRFLEYDTIFRWIGEEILETKSPIVLGQIGFSATS